MAVVYYNKERISENPIDEQNLKLLYVCQADDSETIIPTAMHEHTNHLEIQFISGGMADIRISGFAYRVKEGDVHGMSFYNCGIKNLKLPYLPEGHLLPHDVKPVLHSGNLSKDIRSIFHLLFKQVAEKKIYAAYVCKSLLKALLVILTTQLPQEKLIRRDKFDASFQVCKAFIDEHFTENISVEELSKIANMSVSGFSHHFKKIFGISPGQYLIRLKIITEISMSLGYDNISHFNNQFKKFVGTSPQNYRKLWLGNEQFQNLNHIYNELMKL